MAAVTPQCDVDARGVLQLQPPGRAADRRQPAAANGAAQSRGRGGWVFVGARVLRQRMLERACRSYILVWFLAIVTVAALTVRQPDGTSAGADGAPGGGASALPHATSRGLRGALDAVEPADASASMLLNEMLHAPATETGEKPPTAAAASPAPPPSAEVPLSSVRCHRMAAWGDVCAYENVCFDGSLWLFLDANGAPSLAEAKESKHWQWLEESAQDYVTGTPREV
jgi:hypothetical protein